MKTKPKKSRTSPRAQLADVRALAIEEAARDAERGGHEVMARRIRALAPLPSTLVAVERTEWERTKRLSELNVANSKQWLEVNKSIAPLADENATLRTQLAAAQAEVKELKDTNLQLHQRCNTLDAKSEERRRALEANTPRCDCDAPNCAAIRAAIKDTPAEAPKGEES